MQRLTLSCRASYISLIKKYPEGMPNRLEHFDKWVTTWQDPNFPTYYDFFVNAETREHEAFIPECPKAKTALNEVEFNHRPGLAEFHRRYFPFDNHFADDQHLSEDLKDKTLKSFFKGFSKAETRTELQRLAVWGSLAFILTVSYFYYFMVENDDEQTIVQLEPHSNFFNYQANYIRTYIKACIDKINFLEKHSREERNEAKKRSLSRRKKVGQ